MPTLGRRGFTILEAVVALAIVGFAAVAALEAVGSELRGADRAALAYTAAALAQDRLAAAMVLGADEMNPPPDSVTRGVFPAPFEGFRWLTSVQPTFGERDMYDVTISITSDRSDYTIVTRLYRPRAQVSM